MLILSELFSLLQEYNATNMSVYALRRVSVEVGDIIIKKRAAYRIPFPSARSIVSPPLERKVDPFFSGKWST